MMNVSWSRYSLLLASCALAISGCKDPDVSVGSLGKKLSAPSLTGTSPFDQDMQENGYVRFQGTCDSRVQYVSLSLDDATYFILPTTPNYSNTNLTGTEVNDTSCESDGKFDFYLTKNDLTSWGYATDVDVDTLYLRGTMSGNMETRVLAIKDPNPGSGNGNGGNSGAATQVILEKFWPTGFAGSNQCEYFNATIRDANKNHTTATSTVTFSLDKLVAGTLSRNITAYISQSDCTSGVNAGTSFGIPAGENSVTIYYKFPTTPMDGTLQFRTSSVNLATTESEYTSVVLRDSTSDRYWVSSYSPYKVAKDTCTKGNFEARFYNGTAKSLYASNAWTPVVAGTNAGKVFFYSDAACVNKVTAIDGTAGNTSFYFKYIGGVETDTSTLKFTLNHNVDTATFGAYDDNVHNFEIDRSGNLTVTKIDFYLPTAPITRGTCQQTQINTYNNQGTSVTPSLNVNIGGGNTQFFASYNDCETLTNDINSLSLTAPQTAIYYRTTAVPGSTQTLTLTSTGFTAVARQLHVSAKATHASLLFNGNASFGFPAANTCTPFALETILTDSMGDGTRYVNNFGEDKNFQIVIPTGYTIYSDTNCSTLLSVSTMGMTVGNNTNGSGVFNFYIKANSAPTAGQFYTNQSTPGTTGYLNSTASQLYLVP